MKKIIFIFLFALILRLAFLGVWYAADRGKLLSSDSQSYFDIAENLAEGRGFQSKQQLPTARRPPLYPVLISGALKMGMPFPLSVQVAQSILSSLCAIFLFLIGREVFTPQTGFWASLLFAVDYDAIRATVSILSETTFLFFLLASFLFFYLAISKNKKSFIFISGILAGFSVLTRDVLIFFFPFMGLCFFFLNLPRKEAAVKSAIFLLAFLLSLAPWITRNILVFKKPSLVTITAGHTFYLANNIYATGGRTGGDWEINKDTRYPVGVNAALLPDTSAEDHYLMNEGIKFIVQNPIKFLGLAVTKIVNTWRPFQTDAHPVTKWVQGVSYCVIMLLAMGGIYQSQGRRLQCVPVFMLFGYVFLLHAVLISGIRYRFPVMPFLMLFAGFMVSRVKTAAVFLRNSAHAHSLF